MKSRYDGNPGKEASIANVRQGRMGAEHSASDAFVKKVQAAQAKNQGKAPVLKAEAMNFNAYMCNNGMHAQALAANATKGMDKTAYPLKEPPRDSEEGPYRGL